MAPQPGDSVQTMEFSPLPTATGWPLAVSAWDCTITIYNINPQANTQASWISEPMAQAAQLDSPVFGMCWSEPIAGENAPNGVSANSFLLSLSNCEDVRTHATQRAQRNAPLTPTRVRVHRTKLRGS